MATCACARLVNQCSFKHSSRKRPSDCHRKTAEGSLSGLQRRWREPIGCPVPWPEARRLPSLEAIFTRGMQIQVTEILSSRHAVTSEAPSASAGQQSFFPGSAGLAVSGRIEGTVRLGRRSYRQLRPMSGEYRNNHYVPIWYQKRFLPPGCTANELFHMDMKPGTFTDPRGVVHNRRAVKRRGLRRCFAEIDLYTRQFGAHDPTQLERVFFGAIDARGRQAVEYFAGFEHPSADHDAFPDLLAYMTVQKLRTPKGLAWLAKEARTTDRDRTLELLVRLQRVYAAIWTECIWLLADATASPTKFIVSDHPVTVYNRRCGPKSSWCRGADDPDIRFHASHTLFPLSAERILVLTNLSWTRNPYQLETRMRPNPNFFRDAIFNFTEIQTRRPAE